MHAPDRSRAFSVAEGTALATLCIAAVVAAWPILTGGFLTYADNPVHLGEIHSLAFEAQRGWSSMAYCGFPLGNLHSPLWYGGLGLAARLGLPAQPLYAAALLLGFLAPALALYAVARRRLSPALACALAYLLLVQRPALVGLGSALGGMWTFYLASAFWILLVDRIVQPPRPGRDAWRDLVWIATLVALIVLTHLFLVIPTAFLGLIHVGWRLRRWREDAELLVKQTLAGIVGVVAAAVYWVPLLYTSERLSVPGSTLSFSMVLARLFVPSQILDLLTRRFATPDTGVLLEALPMWILFAVGFLGVLFLRRRKDDTPLYGILVALFLWATLTWGPQIAGSILSGALTWRLLYVVRLGLALAAIPALAALPALPRRARRPVWLIAALVGVAATPFWSRALRHDVLDPRGVEMQGVQQVWEWLRANRSDAWGRVYLQDTFWSPRVPEELLLSHVLARTAAETGVHQLGAGYSAVPYPTAPWVAAEFGRIFGSAVRSRDDLGRLRAAIGASNTTHLVTRDPRMAAGLAGTRLFAPLYRTQSFTILGVQQTLSQWVQVEGSGVTPHVEYATGQIAIETRSGYGGAPLLVKESYHPFWRLQDESAARIEPSERGLMRITGAAPGAQRLELRYVPPRWPLAVSLVVWIGIVLVALRARRTRHPGRAELLDVP
ncbi:MAG: hypothetical protein JSW67_08800 [Candidatus Latescibacterota bacterium]|nr:MAG: hypothetical protein JSW67_08800 [Candidatus Latescibacterota bacterium]